MQNKVVYPIRYLLRTPTMFYAVSQQLGGFIEPGQLRDFFFDLFSASLDPENFVGDLDDHMPEQVMFEASKEGDHIQIHIQLDNGDAYMLSGDEKTATGIEDEGELHKASYIYHSIISKLESVLPEREGDIFLVDTPSPTNNYLQKDDDSGAVEGEMSFHSDPQEKIRFRLVCDKNRPFEITFFANE